MTPMFMPVTYGPEGETKFCRTDNVNSITVSNNEIRLHDVWGGVLNVHTNFNPEWLSLLAGHGFQQH